jgi:hypothetical protein
MVGDGDRKTTHKVRQLARRIMAELGEAPGTTQPPAPPQRAPHSLIPTNPVTTQTRCPISCPISCLTVPGWVINHQAVFRPDGPRE